jgi:hypothetical protein
LLREPSPVRQISGDVAALEFVHGRWDGRERERAREGGRGGGRAAVIEGGISCLPCFADRSFVRSRK